MDLSKYFNAAPKVRSYLNIGCLMDIPTGAYRKGKHGESILNGGLAQVTGVGGRGNTFKSVILHFMNERVLDRYIKSVLQLYDTECTVTYPRLEALAQHMPNLAGLDLEDTGRVFISDSSVMSGNKWFNGVRDFAEDKAKAAKDWMHTTPFVDPKTGAMIRTYYPSLFEIDSLSMFLTDSVEKIYDENQVGDSKMNTDSLRGAAAKSQMLMQMPNVAAMHGLHISMSMHVGDQHQLDPHAPPKKQLAFLQGGVAFKHVPQKTMFLMNNLWYVMNTRVEAHKEQKTPLYPKNPQDNLVGDKDLQAITVVNLRAKSGPSGMPFEIILSQSEGVLVGLTEYNYCKGMNKFGIGGNDIRFFMDLLPDEQLMRTTIRGKCEENAKLRRALEITSEMCQMQNLWDDPEEVFCTPAELYADLKAAGYDWDVLLDTRGYWVFEEHAKDEKPFLSTMDLMRMRKKLYHPYWHKKVSPVTEAVAEVKKAA